MNYLNIVIATKYLITRLGIKKILSELDKINIVGEFENSMKLIDLMKNSTPDLLILESPIAKEDSNERNDIVFIEKLKLIYPKIKIIAILTNTDHNLIKSMIEKNVHGLMQTNDSAEALKQAINCMRKNSTYKSERITKLLQYLPPNKISPYKFLSPKKSEVIKLFASGMKLTEIAEKLNRNIKTVSSQKKSAMVELGIKNDIELMYYIQSNTDNFRR